MAGKTYKSKYKGEGGLFTISGTSGQTYKGKKKKETSFFDFNVVDNLKKSYKRIKEALD